MFIRLKCTQIWYDKGQKAPKSGLNCGELVQPKIFPGNVGNFREISGLERKGNHQFPSSISGKYYGNFLAISAFPEIRGVQRKFRKRKYEAKHATSSIEEDVAKKI